MSGLRLEAARLLRRAGETAAPLRAVADALDSGRYTVDAAELAGLIGPDAAGLVPRLRSLLDDRHVHHAAALAIRRITGEAAPLLDAVRPWLSYRGAGRWFVESLRELGADAAPLLPELRDLAHAMPRYRVAASTAGRSVRTRRNAVTSSRPWSNSRTSGPGVPSPLPVHRRRLRMRFSLAWSCDIGSIPSGSISLGGRRCQRRCARQ